MILEAIAPLSNTGHNYPYSCGYMLSVVLHTMSMVLYVVNVYVRICLYESVGHRCIPHMKHLVRRASARHGVDDTVGWGRTSGDESTTKLSDQEH